MTSSLVAPTFLISYARPASYNDYRCAVNATATTAIFERSAVGTPNTKSILYSLDLAGGADPTPFLTGGAPLYSGRPDWCWANDEVVFNCVPSAGDAVCIGYTSDGGSSTTLVPATDNMFYPAWFPPSTGTPLLAVMNQSSDTSPKPNTSEVDLDGNVQATALAGSGFWAGMPSVNQTSPNLIAFAGQLVQGGATYQQSYNYIWIVNTEDQTVTPLETGMSPSSPFMPQFQGRAPWWSPDGKWIAFESNRAHQPSAKSPEGLYAIFLYEYGSGGPAIQVTDPVYNANHAKWFPNGTELIVAAFQPGVTGQPPSFPWGLASLDVSSIVGVST